MQSFQIDQASAERVIEILQAHLRAQEVFIFCLCGAMEGAGVITVRHLKDELGKQDLGMDPLAREMLDKLAQTFIGQDDPQASSKVHLRVVE